MIQPNDQMRLARMEAICDQLRSEMDDILKKAYDAAVENQDEERAAELARKIRNKLLDASDKQCTFDKILPAVPTGLSFTDWIGWLKELASVTTNAWGVYRQSLRDLPEQEGFPFSIEWPKHPEDEINENDGWTADS